MPHQWWSYLEWVVLALVSLLSGLKGAAAERNGAVLILGTNVAGDIALILAAPHVPQLTLFCLDFMLAIGLLAIAFRFSSLWLGAAMLLQSIILFTHALALDDGEISSFAFIVTNNVVSWLMYACLLGATLMSWRTRIRRVNAKRIEPISDMACPVESSTADVRTGLSAPLYSILAL